MPPISISEYVTESFTIVRVDVYLPICWPRWRIRKPRCRSMTEQELAGRFITEMQSFSWALRQRLTRITDAATPTEREAAGRELRGLAEAMGTLCSSFQVTDCAALGAYFGRHFRAIRETPCHRARPSRPPHLVVDDVEQRLQQYGSTAARTPSNRGG